MLHGLQVDSKWNRLDWVMPMDVLMISFATSMPVSLCKSLGMQLWVCSPQFPKICAFTGVRRQDSHPWVEPRRFLWVVIAWSKFHSHPQLSRLLVLILIKLCFKISFGCEDYTSKQICGRRPLQTSDSFGLVTVYF